MKTLSRSVIALVACISAVSFGCASKVSKTDDGSDSVENADSTDASASAGQSSRFDQMLYGPLTGQDPDAAAGSLAAAQWWPAGCATRSRDATNSKVVHIHLNDCSGPFGLVHHTGDITVTFSTSGGSLHANAASSDMTVNGKPVTYSSDADITVGSGTIQVKFDGAWTRENAKGETVSHTRSGTTDIDLATRCRDTNGTAVTHVAAREVDSTITDYKICRRVDGADACPSGEIVHENKLSGKTITTDFDGSAEAKITGPKGNSIEVPLICLP